MIRPAGTFGDLTERIPKTDLVETALSIQISTQPEKISEVNANQDFFVRFP